MVDQIVAKLIEVVKKKNKAGVSVKPFQVGLAAQGSSHKVVLLHQCAENELTFLSLALQVKNHIWVFVNALIENPSFDSQTKENMTLQTKSFGSKCPLSDKFIRAVRNRALFPSGCWLGVFFFTRKWPHNNHESTLSPTGDQLRDRRKHTQLGEVQSSDAAE